MWSVCCIISSDGCHCCCYLCSVWNSWDNRTWPVKSISKMIRSFSMLFPCLLVGYILGLGDRHVQNILIDCQSAELIHIDLGVAFEQGRILPTPETVPFRLTRDIVDGMGVAGVEGVFRRCVWLASSNGTVAFETTVRNETTAVGLQLFSLSLWDLMQYMKLTCVDPYTTAFTPKLCSMLLGHFSNCSCTLYYLAFHPVVILSVLLGLCCLYPRFYYVALSLKTLSPLRPRKL